MRRVITVAAIAGLLILAFRGTPAARGGSGARLGVRDFSRSRAWLGAAPGQSGLAYSMGFVVATGSTWCGILMELLHAWRTGRLALRVSGSAIALAGPVFLWRALA